MAACAWLRQRAAGSRQQAGNSKARSLDVVIPALACEAREKHGGNLFKFQVSFAAEI